MPSKTFNNKFKKHWAISNIQNNILISNSSKDFELRVMLLPSVQTTQCALILGNMGHLSQNYMLVCPTGL